jgi:hypothetical protein
MGSVTQTDPFSSEITLEVEKKVYSSGIHFGTQTIDHELFD